MLPTTAQLNFGEFISILSQVYPSMSPEVVKRGDIILTVSESKENMISVLRAYDAEEIPVELDQLILFFKEAARPLPSPKEEDHSIFPLLPQIFNKLPASQYLVSKAWKPREGVENEIFFIFNNRNSLLSILPSELLTIDSLQKKIHEWDLDNPNNRVIRIFNPKKLIS